MQVKVTLVLALDILKSLAIFSQSFRVLNNQLVTVVNFANEEITLFLVGLLELTQFFHDVLSMRLQVLEDLGLDFILLSDLIHAPLDRLIFIVDLVLEDFALRLQIRKLQVDLLKDIKLTVSLEDGLFKVLNLCIGLFLLLTQLIDIILVVDQAINYRVNQLLYQMPGL